jgi:hemin uptake protein HemP
MGPAGLESTAERARPSRVVVRRIDSDLLLQREREIVIVHRGQEYHLRLTRSDKLILTK